MANATCGGTSWPVHANASSRPRRTGRRSAWARSSATKKSSFRCRSDARHVAPAHASAGAADYPLGEPSRVIRMSQYASFREFYPFYLGEHSDVQCRRMHFAGSTLVLVVIVTTIATGN